MEVRYCLRWGLRIASKMRAITNGRLIVNGTIVEGKTLFFDTHILKISSEKPSKEIEVIDAKGCYVGAGFIDIHIHGAGGADVMDASFNALETISSTLLQTGVTSFLATTMTMSSNAIEKALANIQAHAKKVSGAEILGVHLEGPFINPNKCGAQDKKEIKSPNIGLIKPYISQIKMITLAPEVEGAEDFIKQLKSQYPNIVLSIGHSEASYTQTKQSFDWGVSHATHLFNAMPSYHHREPSIVGAVLQSDVSCDMIADLVHTHPSTLDLVYRMKKEKLLLITDAMRAGCMRSGLYDLGGQRVEVAHKQARLADGTLAGSVLKMYEALENMTTHTTMGLLEAIYSVTKAPAQRLGMVTKGDIEVGYEADIVIFDTNFLPHYTIVGGNVKYTSVSDS